MRNFKFNHVAVFLVFPIVLSGCGDNKVASLKESPVPGHEEYTVEQIFDNRELCDKTSWKSYVGDRGENIVEYVCHMKNVKEYEEKLVARYSRKLREVLEGENKLERKVRNLREEISDDEAWLVKEREELNEEPSSREISRLMKRSKEGREYLDYLSSVNIQDVLEDGVEINKDFLSGSQLAPEGAARELENEVGGYLPPRDFYSEISSLLRTFNYPGGGGPLNVGEVSQDEIKENKNEAKIRLREVLFEMKEVASYNVERIEGELKNYVDDWRKIREKNIEQRAKSISRNKERIEEAVASFEDHDRDFSNHIELLVSKLEEGLGDAYAREVFRWVLMPSDDFKLVYAAFEEKSAIRGEDVYEYHDSKYAVKRIYENKLVDFEAFMETTGGDEQKRYLLGSELIKLRSSY